MIFCAKVTTLVNSLSASASASSSPLGSLANDVASQLATVGGKRSRSIASPTFFISVHKSSENGRLPVLNSSICEIPIQLVAPASARRPNFKVLSALTSTPSNRLRLNLSVLASRLTLASLAKNATFPLLTSSKV